MDDTPAGQLYRKPEIRIPKGRKNGESRKGQVTMVECEWREKASTANATHGTGRRDKVFLTDMVTSFFLPDHLLEPFGNFFIRASVTEQRPEVVFEHTEKAGSNFAISGQPNAIAMAAERLADRGDDAYLAPTVGKDPAFRCR